jgi:hypothetical protein
MDTQEHPILISPRKLMGLIGLMAFSLPVLVVILAAYIGNCYAIQGSISAYYHTESRNVFVGILCALSFAFFCYKGYDKSDSLLGNFAATMALGVAFFPTNIDPSDTSICLNLVQNKVAGQVHYISAFFLFLSLAYFSFFQFTKSENGSSFKKVNWIKLTPSKKTDNIIYIVCGLSITMCLIIIGFYFLTLSNERKVDLVQYKPVFFLETFMIWIFGFAWVRKSKYFVKKAL